jgi:NAD(P)-dependent dehydrogenase (short-subunit alcohol dehydrogenase family)
VIAAVQALFSPARARSRRTGAAPPLDLAANVAGIPQAPAPLAETTLELWDTTHAVNDRGLFLCLYPERGQ